jgi:class 3 adenylate cyclase
VTNLAARLCGEAKGGQILVSKRVFAAVQDYVEVEPVGELAVRGFARPVPAFNLVAISEERIATSGVRADHKGDLSAGQAGPAS